MKCNLAAPLLLSIVPASSLAPLALGAFAIASALATQRLNAEPRRGGRQGRRSRGRADARPDRRAGKKGRHPAPSGAVGLPEATAEIIASLGEHRVLSTEQVRTIHLPDRSLRRTQQILAGIEEAGLIHHVDSRVAPRRLWFVSERGARLRAGRAGDAAEGAPGRRRGRPVEGAHARRQRRRDLLPEVGARARR